MKQINFLFNNIGPFAGLTDGTLYMRKQNVFVPLNIFKEIKKEYLNHSGDYSDPVFIELTNTPVGYDGLVCLVGFDIQIIDGYHICEYKNIEEYDLETAKEVMLDGHYVDILLQKPDGFPNSRNEYIDFSFQKIYHGKWDNYDEAVLFILNELGFSKRNSKWKNTIDEEILRGDTFARYYKHPEYLIGDLGKSVPLIPEKIFNLNESDINHWCQKILKKAKEMEPHVFWYMNELPLELRVYKESNRKEVEEKKADTSSHETEN